MTIHRTPLVKEETLVSPLDWPDWVRAYAKTRWVQRVDIIPFWKTQHSYNLVRITHNDPHETTQEFHVDGRKYRHRS